MTLPPTYTRIAPPRPGTQPGSDLECGLIELGTQMRDCERDVHDPDLPEAGYTYFGQFIDHDVTLDATPLGAATPDLRLSRNLRTPFLDLDHVYGGGPRISPFLYDRRSERNAEKFLIGITVPPATAPTGSAPGSDASASTSLAPSPNDLPRNIQGRALTADARQDENLIIAQLHTAFLKFHNLMIDRLKSGTIGSAGPDGGTPFAQAQRLVTWHYQWMVRCDFLKRILAEDVFQSLEPYEMRQLQNPPEDARIPVEFSVAAFRFGHSTVRDFYHYNLAQKKVCLPRLRERTGFGPEGAVPLPEDWVAEWDRFFTIPNNIANRNRARKIDTLIANGLHSGVQLSSFFGELSAESAAAGMPLPVVTLLRGGRIGLATGQDLAAQYSALEPGIQVLTPEQVVRGDHKTTLTNTRYGFKENTPLWYYVLKEAEVLHAGRCLGPVGSRIVGRVLVDQLVADPQSYLRAAPTGWQPPFAATIATLLRKLRSI